VTEYNTSTYLGFITITAKKDTLTVILPIPSSQTTISIRPLIDNKQGLEREVDDEGFAESGFIRFQLINRLLSCSRDSCFLRSLVHIEMDHCKALN